MTDLALTATVADQPQVAVEAARQAYMTWARTAPADRAAAVSAAANALEDHAHDLAALHANETGKLESDALESIGAGAGTLRQYAELGPLHRGHALQGGWDATDFMVRQPRGVVVALTPWNDPVAVACGLIGAALVTGNTVVHKPSERAVRTGVALDAILADCVPSGVLRTVVGDGSVGAELTANPDVALIAHVGSTATGRAIAQAAVATGAKVLLENGGNDPLIIDSTVDPTWAAEQAALGSFANGGQICTSVERIYVHRDIAEPFLTALVEGARNWVPEAGAGQNALCSLVDTEHRATVHAHVEAAVAAGATLLTGGKIPEGPGSWYPATVLSDCDETMAVMSEETFGPVAPVRVVDDFEQALASATSGHYGLAATVLTASADRAQRAWRELPVGTVKVNGVFGGAPGGAAQPRGLSGTGFGYGPELLDEMTTMKVVHMEQAWPR